MCFSSRRFWSWPGLLHGTIGIVSRCTASRSQCRISFWKTCRTEMSARAAHSEGPLVMPIKVRLMTLNVKLITHFRFVISGFLFLTGISFPPFSQEHLPGTLPGPISGPVPHTAGQWCLQQATVAQLPPHCHVDPERFAAPWERILVLPCQYGRLHQTALVYRLCHHPYGRHGWKLSTGRGLCPFFPQFWGAPQPHALRNLHPLLVLFIVFNLRPLPAPQIQKGQAFNLFVGQEKGDHGVKTKLSQGAHGVALCGGLVFMCVWTVCFYSSVFVTVHNGSYYYQTPPPKTLSGPCGPQQYQKDSIREATVWIKRLKIEDIPHTLNHHVDLSESARSHI